MTFCIGLVAGFAIRHALAFAGEFRCHEERTWAASTIDTFLSKHSGVDIQAPQKEIQASNEKRIKMTERPQSMILMRAIGNALPPRHHENQTLTNLEFVLEHEQIFPNMSRHWMINRIVDPKIENQVVKMLNSYGETYTLVPFDASEFRKQKLHFERTTLYGMPTAITAPMHAHAHHERLVYAMNVNGIRNTMINHGKTQSNADFILPWDGNCFMTKPAWEAIQTGLKKHRDRNYFLVPLDRLLENNSALLLVNYKPNPVEEPQVIFSRKSTSTFNPSLAYGRLNKLELIARLEHKHIGDKFSLASWENDIMKMPFASDSGDGKIPSIGWITRLSSGNPGQEKDRQKRYDMRMLSLQSFLHKIDQATLSAPKKKPRLVIDESYRGNTAERKTLLASVQRIDKKEWKQDTTTLTVERQEAVAILTVAGISTSEKKYLDRAAGIVRTWLDSGESKTPKRELWKSWRKTNLLPFLDAISILHTRRALTETETGRIKDILRGQFEDMFHTQPKN